MTNPVRRAAGGLWHATRQVVLVAVGWLPGLFVHRGAAEAAQSLAWDPDAERKRNQPDLE